MDTLTAAACLAVALGLGVIVWVQSRIIRTLEQIRNIQARTIRRYQSALDLSARARGRLQLENEQIPGLREERAAAICELRERERRERELELEVENLRARVSVGAA